MKYFVFSLLLFSMTTTLADDRASVPSWYWGCGDVTPDQCRRMIESRHGVAIAPEPVSPAPQKPAVTTPPQRQIVRTPPPAKPKPQRRSKEAQLADKVLELTNQYRQSHGLRPLKVDNACWDAAFDHAKDMAKRLYFDHNSPDGRTHVDRYNRRNGSGRGYWKLSENIAAGTDMTPAEAMYQWKTSSGHRRNILDSDVTHMGVGVAPGRCFDGSGGTCYYYVQCFVRPQ